MACARAYGGLDPRTADTGERAIYSAIVVIGAVLWWLSTTHPALLPFWAPWDFSPPVYLATTLVPFWFFRGLRLAPAMERPAIWRCVAFLLGVTATYAVLQTRFEYWSQHMFFLNRIQHVVMHHLGPFLIALGCAGGMIKRGMPRRLRRIVESGYIAAAMRVLQQPPVAAFLFVGLFYFWLIPVVHFRAMIDVRLYAVMNWSMCSMAFCSGAWCSTRVRARRRGFRMASAPPWRSASCFRRSRLVR
jgi:putative membrane protein